ncbi:MAG: hypothetical protein N2045_01975 [Fimbriimonadales bacterium]|jgi:hypothetical protein|nr:hypothetical protein [Fimbriimonadales bacterium]GBC89469.1 hypothetical protein HRbin14_00194 [bacterium HR14]CUU10540.1 hypothetical protein GBSOP10_10714 [Armatimonadetes bacterium GBS]CUU36053.1 hypothetical protein GXSOP10_122116 [Armatimonadetes bacterium GXS]
MGIRVARERGFRVSDLWRTPLERLAALTARFSGWFNQERWTNLLLITALTVANLVILVFILQGQENRAVAFTVLALIAPLAFLVPEINIVTFILAGTGLFVNAFYYVLEAGTGERALSLVFLFLLSARAVYEHLKTPPEKRIKVFSWFVILLVVFWIYYMFHVGYIYLFRYDEVPPDDRFAALGFYRTGVFRYFDRHMLWIGVVPLIILLSDIRRAKRILTILGVVASSGVVVLLWEYFVPLPPFAKILFQLRAAGETTEGYRVREPASLYLIVAGFMFALYSLGFYKGWRVVAAVIYLLGAAYVILITKNRALWGAMMLIMPMVLLWKPPAALMHQARIAFMSCLFVLVLLMHPVINEAAARIVTESVQRWERNFAYGGDPRLDPSYQARVREREAWEVRMQTLTPFQRLFGAGLEEPYGRYISLGELGYRGPGFDQVYVERIEMHFAWLARLLHIGLVGTGLMVVLMAGFFIRAAQAFFTFKDPLWRAVIVGITGGMVAAIGYDLVHSDYLNSQGVAPIIFLWSLIEAMFHWKRTGQLESTQPNST